MYKDIEEIYKKKSPYNKIKIRIFLVSFFATPFLLVFNYYETYFMMIITFIIVIFVMKKVFEKILNQKLYFTNQTKGRIPLDKITEKKRKYCL